MLLLPTSTAALHHPIQCRWFTVTLQKLDSIYHAPLIMSSKQLEEGISNFGDTKRLERTMWKLVTGMSLLVHCA